MKTLTRRSPRELRQLLQSAAAPLRGFVTTTQLRALDIGTSTVTSLVHSAVLHPIMRGVYHLLLARDQLSREEWMIARVLAAGREGRLGGIAGLAAYDFSRFPAPDRIEILTPARCRVEIPDARCRTVAELAEQPPLSERGIPVPELNWLMCDLGRDLTRFQVANVIHRAEYHRRRLGFDLDQFMERPDLSNNAGISEVRRAIGLHLDTSAGTRSFPEDTYVGIAQDVTGRDPLVNCVVSLDGRSYEIDIGILPERVHVHIDGGQHGRIHDAAVDPIRTEVAERNGFIEIREHSTVVQRDRRGCARRLMRALEQARARW